MPRHGAVPRHGAKHRRRCTRLVRVGSFTHADAGGTNTIRFSGRLGRRVLAPGRYVLDLQASNSAGGGNVLSARFRVQAPARSRRRH